MFTCYLHGWNSHDKICPMCFKVETYSTTDTINIHEKRNPICEHSVAAHRFDGGPWNITMPLVCGKCGIKLKLPEKWEIEL